MEAFFSKLKNWWYYYKIPAGILICVLVIVIYFSVQSGKSPEADYHVGLVSTTPRSEEELSALTDGLAAFGEDLNDDGEIRIQLHTYAVDLADSSEYAGYNNYEIIAALDADLIGKTSGIFLLEDPKAFQSVSNALLAEPFLPYEDGLYLCIRTDAPDAYSRLFDQAGNF